MLLSEQYLIWDQWRLYLMRNRVKATESKGLTIVYIKKTLKNVVRSGARVKSAFMTISSNWESEPNALEYCTFEGVLVSAMCVNNQDLIQAHGKTKLKSTLHSPQRCTTSLSSESSLLRECSKSLNGTIMLVGSRPPSTPHPESC